MTQDVQFVVGDEKWQELRAKALRSLYFFNATILGLADKFALDEPTHLLFHLFLQRKTGCKELDEAPFQLVMMPRDTGKTSCGTIGYAIWRACQNPDTAILIANEKQENASDFLASIKHHFETNELLRSLFPEVVPPDFNKTTWAATRATLKRTSSRPEPTFDTIGVGGTVVGRHYDEIICDDLVAKEAMEAARAGNWEVMRRVNRWVNQLVPLLSHSAKPFPTIRFIGTRWWLGDTYDHIEEVFGYGEAARRVRMRARSSLGSELSRECYRVGDLAVFRMSAIENGATVFSAIWPDEEIAKFRMRDPELAACNLFNDPTASDIRVFRDEWLHYWTHADPRTLSYEDDTKQRKFVAFKDLHKLISVDPAFSSSKDAARSAIIVLGTDMATGAHFVLDALVRKADPKDVIVDILNSAHNWGCSRVFVELAGQQIAFSAWLEKAARERNTPIVVEPLKPGGRNKALRIESLVIPFKDHRLYVHQGQIALLDEEYRRWRPGYQYQDGLDALAYALEVAPKPLGTNALGGGGSAAGRSRAALDGYLQRLKGARHWSRIPIASR